MSFRTPKKALSSTKAFVLKRTAIARIGEDPILATIEFLYPGSEDIVFPEGFSEAEAKRVLDESPRALWLLAFHKLLPMTEAEALRFIIQEGRTIEQGYLPVANVHHMNTDSVAIQRMIACNRWASLPKRPTEPKIVTIE